MLEKDNLRISFNVFLVSGKNVCWKEVNILAIKTQESIHIRIRVKIGINV